MIINDNDNKDKGNIIRKIQETIILIRFKVEYKNISDVISFICYQRPLSSTHIQIVY